MTDWAEGLVETKADYKSQGSQAWKQWRNKGIGSSDAAVLLGWSPWKDLHELYLEKIGQYKPEFGWAQQRAMDQGKEMEPVIRKWFEQKTGTLWREDAEESKLHPVFRASYDGINRSYVNEDGSVGALCEIKYPNAKDHELAKNQMLPDKYQAQVQWLLMVAGLSWAYYISLGRDETYAVVPVKENLEIQKELTKRALYFWECVQNKTPPQELPRFEPGQLNLNLEHPSIPDQEIEAVCAEALKIKAEIEALEARFEVCKATLKKALGNETKMVKGEAVFGIQERKGLVDYSRIPELQNLDLDPYRKAPTYAFYFKRLSGSSS